jgi:hypothetical protein
MILFCNVVKFLFLNEVVRELHIDRGLERVTDPSYGIIVYETSFYGVLKLPGDCVFVFS